MQAELDHFLTRKILLQNSLPLQSHAHCLVRLVSTVRWASVGKKAERGVEGTAQAREGDFKVFTETTHTCMSLAKKQKIATSLSKSKKLMSKQCRGSQANQAQRFDGVD